MKALSSILALICLLTPTIHAEEAASPTAGLRIIENIRYSETAGEKGFGDLYLPAEPKNARPLLLIHGGAWKKMDRFRMNRVAEFLAAQGYAVFNVSYRLIPQADYPACEQDCITAGNFLLEASHPDMAQLDRSKLVVIGASAGGHLALMTGLKLPPDRVAGIIDISGPTDLTSPEIRNLMIGSGMFKGQPSEQYEASLRAASPVTIAADKAPADLPPLLVLQSENDKIVEAIQARKIADLWKQKARPLQEYFWPGREGMTHDIWRSSANGPFLREELEAQIRTFLETYFPKS